MKNLFISLAILCSINAFAGNCESDSYQVTIQDYVGNCKELIIDASIKAGCNKEQVSVLKNKIQAGNMNILSSSSSTFCKVSSSNGHYQVMTDDMPEPPVATLFFSRND